MNKSELIEAVANSAELSKASAGKVVDAVIASITNTLKEGDQVAIAGFGTFLVRHREARTGRNPRTGETIYSLSRLNSSTVRVSLHRLEI
jgi:DNA-binding protein HU-beta